jgi:hypothetical protein
VRKKLALFSVLATLAVSLFAAQAAYASYTYVLVTPNATGFCRTAPDVLSYRLAFTAQVTAVGISKPKQARIAFQVVDSDTKRVIRTDVVYLKRSKGYKGQTKRFEGTAGENVTYHLNLSYSTGGTKTKKLKKSFDDTIPSQADMDSAGVPNC